MTFPDTASTPLYFGACDGTSPLYELDAAGPGPYSLTLTDLSPGGSRIPLSGNAASSWAITGGAQPWSVAPLATAIAGNVLSAASYTDQIAPGGLISIFGAGLAGSGTTTVQVNGQSASVIAATPFQVNAQIPVGTSVGSAQLTVTSSNGSARQQVAIAPVAPAIFSISASQAAITNSDNSLNTTSNPVKRGGVIVIYATGFGVTASSGEATTPVTMPPGLALPLYLKQGSAVSNTVPVAVE